MGPQALFRKYERMVHPYSGLDPTSWKRFLDNLHVFEQSVSTRPDDSADALYSACENIRDLGLGLRHADDTDIQEKLNLIASELGFEGEMVLQQKATSSGLYFYPRYLNESLAEYPEHVDTRPPGRFKSHGQ